MAQQIMYVTVKTLYGTQRIYPACKLSKTIADIAGTKTLSKANLLAAVELDIDHKVLAQQIEL